MPQPSPNPTNKRDRDGDTHSGVTPITGPVQPSPIEQTRHFAGTKRVSDVQKARQDQFRSALSSSLSSMHLNGSANTVPPITESYTPSPSSAETSPTPTYPSTDQQPISVSDDYYSSLFASMPPNPASFYPGPFGMRRDLPDDASLNRQGGQPLGMDPMFSTQSMMYDQVLSNLSASLMQAPSPPALPPQDPSASAQYAPSLDDQDGYMIPLNGQGSVPDFAADPNALSMWSAAPNGLE